MTLALEIWLTDNCIFMEKFHYEGNYDEWFLFKLVFLIIRLTISCFIGGIYFRFNILSFKRLTVFVKYFNEKGDIFFFFT